MRVLLHQLNAVERRYYVGLRALSFDQRRELLARVKVERLIRAPGKRHRRAPAPRYVTVHTLAAQARWLARVDEDGAVLRQLRRVAPPPPYRPTAGLSPAEVDVWRLARQLGRRRLAVALRALGLARTYRVLDPHTLAVRVHRRLDRAAEVAAALRAALR